jgi:uncharacterized membrane protein YebE (DUF533 family)
MMNASGLLDRLLRSGQDLLGKQQTGGAPGQTGMLDALGGMLDQGRSGSGGSWDSLGGLLNQDQGGGKPGEGRRGLPKDAEGNSPLSSFLAGAGGGAVAGTLMSLLLGNKSARKIGGKALTYGGLAALGAIAYKAYGNWQASQGAGTPGPSTPPREEPRTLDRLPPALVEEHSRVILLAMVTAAKADGHIDARERDLLNEALTRLSGGDASFDQWLATELNKPLDPAAVARGVTTPEMAAEVYLASLLVVDEEHFLERAYLDELARQLRLDPGLKAELEHQVQLELAQG